jgi:hypothetical protein
MRSKKFETNPFLKCTLPGNHDAPQRTSFLVAEIRARMQSAPVIPQNKIALSPFMSIDELILLDMRK